MLNIWKTQIKQGKGLTPIIPIIVYHGKDRWKYKPFKAYFKELDDFLSGYTPNFDYIKVDLSDYSDEEIKTGIFESVSRFSLMQLPEQFFENNFCM